MVGGLSPKQADRYSRHLVLPDIGEEGQLLLLNSSVLVVGAGGLGSPAIAYLTAAGVGEIGIIDHDVVSVSNLQRQILYSNSTVGKPKVESAKIWIEARNEDVIVNAIEEKMTHDNSLSIIQNYDVIIDGTDNFESRYLIGDSCEILGKPWIFGSVHRFEGQVSTFNLSGGPNYRDLFPESPPPEMAPNCSEAGILGVLPGLVGTIQATEAIKLILNVGESLRGRLLTIDASSMDMRTLSFSRNPDRDVVTNLNAYADQNILEIVPIDFVERKQKGWNPFLLDVRREEEEAITSIDGTEMRIMHLEIPSKLSQIPSGRDIVVYCRTGVRSAAVARFLIESGKGLGKVYNLSGGVHGWSDTVDSKIIKY